jgi:hypothetical protein
VLKPIHRQRRCWPFLSGRYPAPASQICFATEEKKEEPNKRVLGLWEGKGKLPGDFDEPLDELKDYM